MSITFPALFLLLLSLQLTQEIAIRPQPLKKIFKETIEEFDKEGEMWRKTGSIGPKEREQLRLLIKSFEGNFKQVYSTSTAFKRKDELVLKPGVLTVVNLIHEDKFELRNIDAIFAAVKHIFSDSEDYFHIIPQIFNIFGIMPLPKEDPFSK